MDDVLAIDTLVAAIVVGLWPRAPVPQVVLLLAGGVLIGPHVLDLGRPEDVQVLADVGLGLVAGDAGLICPAGHAA
ncbi:hypothetical protein [Geodermatophilus ruber]|uniref:Sodium/hydrogen exchanger family protein n=1 Tax=Geodermatophilus ruber TaxID=504800 RepID=A0A1I4FBK6_9ACTN|nr:hypothetical protein [Geodermatophilus ruber]SFL14247.1 hypothetical protein SAMN04488085_10734 [Geodermatophilus ruber]